MKTFDYETAWHEIAKPGFDTLPQNVRDLYARVCAECEGQGQNQQLGMAWPKMEGPGDSLHTMFLDIPTEWLSAASRIIYFYGHWSPEGHSYLGGGGTWKFALFADQQLCERLGLSRSDAPYPGVAYEVSEGVIRTCLSIKDSWTWVEVAPAGHDAFEKIRERMQRVMRYEGTETPYDFKSKRRMPDNDEYEAFQKFTRTFEELQKVLWPTGGYIAQFRPDLIKDYMVEEAEFKARQEVRKEAKRVAAGHYATGEGI
jgi:hypothetical protein